MRAIDGFCAVVGGYMENCILPCGKSEKFGSSFYICEVGNRSSTR